MNNNQPITKKEYWNEIHTGRENYLPKNFKHFSNHVDDELLEVIKKIYNNGSILEVGAGSSDWLIDIALNLKAEKIAGLDYSEVGCETLRIKTRKIGLPVEVINADIFNPLPTMKTYDFVYSLGVVEHFQNLGETLRAISRLVKPTGILLTVIPNMSGLIGLLTKKWNHEVYSMHVAHDLDSFIEGHHKANLKIIDAFYLGSTNFGVLSSCFHNERGVKFWIYKQLTRVSKLIWIIEKFTGALPKSKLLSPYIVVISQIKE